MTDTGTPGPIRADHVLCVSPSSRNLSVSIIHAPVATALDIGVGGVQAMHLSTHADQVTGIDLSTRALRFAATTAALNKLDWELLYGDMVEPVAASTSW
ncbi:class I SAM-dependent methyltransferase [Nocardia acidivorans]|uniref:class I SAM-dependent methyltransferase n=1 Tax=Nocardia acidivorans TaxID=404580 RepID=UPI00147232C0|nr:class I SAM-dependent methyltransferase [Nocardia acidivorans]